MGKYKGYQSEYDPHLSVGQWEKFIREIELPDHPEPMMMLKGMIMLGGAANVSQLAMVYGGTASRYVGCIYCLGRRAVKFFGIEAGRDVTVDRTLVVPFVASGDKDNDNNLFYTIRAELMDALARIDLSKINPYVDALVEIAPEHCKKLTDIQLYNLARMKSTATPKQTDLVTKSYVRSSAVSEYAKKRANGICQLCGERAPFTKKDGEPYLETHHIIWLANGGADSIENTVALCPNCHRKMHYVCDENDVRQLQEKIRK